MKSGIIMVTKNTGVRITDWESDLIELGVKKSGFSKKNFFEALAQVDYVPNTYYNKPDRGINSGKKMTIFLSDKVHNDFSNKVNKHNVTKKVYWLSLVQAYINNEFELTLDDKEIHTVDIEANRERDKSIGMKLGEVERNLIRQQAEDKGLSIVDYLVDLISNAELKKYVKEKNKYLRKYSLVIKVTEEEHDMIKEKAKFSELSMPNYIMTLVEEDIHKK